MELLRDNGEDATSYSTNDLEDSWRSRRKTTSHLTVRSETEALASRVFNPYYTGRPRKSAENKPSPSTLDRQKIIERIKNSGARALTTDTEQAASKANTRIRVNDLLFHDRHADEDVGMNARDQRSMNGQQIERPRSALHKGDFHEQSTPILPYPHHDQDLQLLSCPRLSTSRLAPWHPEFPTTIWKSAGVETSFSTLSAQEQQSSPNRPRAHTQTSVSNSFVYKAPTSPLAQSSRPDTPEAVTNRASRSPDRSRRHTFSPPALNHFHTVLGIPSADGPLIDQHLARSRTGRSLPYQAHQPRRSIQLGSTSTQSPASTRRTSFSEGPLQHSHMVGSYEESILHGRMSTTPSRPLNFVAQIGVLGRGKCKTSLKCPPHASITFPAVFYSYNSSSKATMTNDQPSPYVGLIDLENQLAIPDDIVAKESLLARYADMGTSQKDASHARLTVGNMPFTGQVKEQRQRKADRRSKVPPGGSYRIPAEGQIQIVIKNPNKTAVKLFLVPYDITDMRPGQKTFIRQRSYSAGPLIEMTEPLYPDRPILRYLVHLHLCCTSKGRYYLYKHIRVVFANRVPDGKEKLRNEIQFPEPRYSVYKPCKETPLPTLSIEQRAPDGVRMERLAPSIFSHTFDVAQSSPFDPYDRCDSDMLMQVPRSPTPVHDVRQLAGQDSVESASACTPSSTRLSLSLGQCGVDSDRKFADVDQLEKPFQFERETNHLQVSRLRSKSLLSRKLLAMASEAQNCD